MNIIQVVSENKVTKKVMQDSSDQFGRKSRRPEWVGGLYKSKIGHAMCIVEENGVRKTKHMVKI